mgnify:FL=1
MNTTYLQEYLNVIRENSNNLGRILLFVKTLGYVIAFWGIIIVDGLWLRVGLTLVALIFVSISSRLCGYMNGRIRTAEDLLERSAS